MKNKELRRVLEGMGLINDQSEFIFDFLTPGTYSLKDAVKEVWRLRKQVDALFDLLDIEDTADGKRYLKKGKNKVEY